MPAPAPSLPVTTDRLTLRRFTEADLDDLHRLHSHPDVARYMYWEPWSRGRAMEGLGKRMQQSAPAHEGDVLDLAVVRSTDGVFLGEVHLQNVSDEHRRAELGFAFHPAHHGHGYAREAATAMLRLAFETFGFRRVIGRCDADNAASAGLMERLGMRREAHLVENEFVKGVWASEYLYAMLATEWSTLASK
ncbi:GNAT family N-acetyltransferase [Jiangella mangrovi]|uniref:RimJ/RimL family protein N-acetyltransferase n=1 Tax=Jiangella mangrovi TaxID=1524084 RepID=A0A7W9LML8_9ACTN|nr:GNAT family N-acetyltransferase [Jiangella mangrovi]MBB5789237.1 RimJ/RimL family protein N-acetyltransferase [Jiangella mangrovi]